MKKKIKQFEEKWCPDKGSGFISPLCHIDDIDLLLKAQKEENENESFKKGYKEGFKAGLEKLG